MTEAPAPQVYALVPSYPAFVAVVKQRAAEKGLSYAALDEIAGLAAGMVGKACGPSGTKKFGPLTMFNVAWGLGLGIAFVEDPEAAAAVIDMALPRHANQARPDNYASPPGKRVKSRVLKYFAKRGGKARMRKMTRAQRSAHQRHAALCRWHKPRVTEIKRRRAPASIPKSARPARAPALRRGRSAGNGARKGRARRQSPAQRV